MSKDYAKLSDSAFYSQFGERNWDACGEAERLALLQELENRVALEEGRKPMTIRCIPADQEQPGLMGYYQNGANCLFITGKFLRRNRFAMNDYSAAAAMSTVLHEGRHAYQHHRIEHLEDGVPDEEAIRWLINLNYYRGASSGEPDHTYAMYLYQSVEADARRFARQRLRRINNFLRKTNGAPDTGIARFLQREQQRENINAAFARRMLTPEMLDTIDEAARDRFREVLWMSGIDADDICDLDDYSIFDDARRILENPDYFDDGDAFEEEERLDSFIPGDALDRLTRRVLDKSRAASAKPDRPDGMTFRPAKRGRGF